MAMWAWELLAGADVVGDNLLVSQVSRKILPALPHTGPWGHHAHWEQPHQRRQLEGFNWYQETEHIFKNFHVGVCPLILGCPSRQAGTGTEGGNEENGQQRRFQILPLFSFVFGPDRGSPPRGSGLRAHGGLKSWPRGPCSVTLGSLAPPSLGGSGKGEVFGQLEGPRVSGE